MRLPIIAAWLTLFALAACGGSEPHSGSREAEASVHVVAGFYPLAEAAREVGGEGVRVANLTPAGAEAHDVELSTDQLDAVLDADLVLYLGGGFQPALEAAIEQRDGPSIDLLVARGQPADPHVWLDPRQFAEMTAEISEGLEAAHPEPAELRRRTEAYAARLRALDVEFEKGLHRCQRRDIVTAHAAFGHLAAAYQLEQKPISGLSPESEPDPARLAELSDHVTGTGATTIFVEPLAPSEAADALARETDTKTVELNPLEGLTPSQVEAGETYESVMRANLDALRRGLDCQ